MPKIISFFKSSYLEKSKSKEIMEFLINLSKYLLKSIKNANDSCSFYVHFCSFWIIAIEIALPKFL